MNRPIYILKIGLIVLICNCSSQSRFEDWYKLSDNSQGERKLIKQIHYAKNGLIDKEIAYNPSETIFQKETDYDAKGNKILETTYYDSTKSLGTIIHYFYSDKFLTKVVAVTLNGRENSDTSIMIYKNEIDSLKRLSKLMTFNGNDTNTIEYRYTVFNKISNILSKSKKHLFSYENFYYNDNNQIKEYILRIPDSHIEKHEFYNYSDTMLNMRVVTNYLDTILIENYVYNEKGLKTNIIKKDYKTKKILRIGIEYK